LKIVRDEDSVNKRKKYIRATSLPNNGYYFPMQLPEIREWRLDTRIGITRESKRSDRKHHQIRLTSRTECPAWHIDAITNGMLYAISSQLQIATTRQSPASVDFIKSN